MATGQELTLASITFCANDPKDAYPFSTATWDFPFLLQCPKTNGTHKSAQFAKHDERTKQKKFFTKYQPLTKKPPVSTQGNLVRRCGATPYLCIHAADLALAEEVRAPAREGGVHHATMCLDDLHGRHSQSESAPCLSMTVDETGSWAKDPSPLPHLRKHAATLFGLSTQHQETQMTPTHISPRVRGERRTNETWPFSQGASPS